MSPRRHTDESSGRVPELEKELAAIRSEREESALAEDRWQNLMELSPFGIVIYRPDGSVVAGNAAMSRIFSLTDAETDAVLAKYNILEDPSSPREV